jgi:hypothetical protein
MTHIQQLQENKKAKVKLLNKLMIVQELLLEIYMAQKKALMIMESLLEKDGDIHLKAILKKF